MNKKTFHLIVDLRDAREIAKLQERIETLEAELKKARELERRASFDLICQHKLNMQLQDYCMENGFKVPARLYTRWRSSCSDEK